MKQLLYIDLFCGAGGTSTGINTSRLDGEQCAEVIACVNHDAHAIASHKAIHQTHGRTWRWGGAYLQSHGHSVMARRDIPDGRCHADIAWSVAVLPV